MNDPKNYRILLKETGDIILGGLLLGCSAGFLYVSVTKASMEHLAAAGVPFGVLLRVYHRGLGNGLASLSRAIGRGKLWFRKHILRQSKGKK